MNHQVRPRLASALSVAAYIVALAHCGFIVETAAAQTPIPGNYAPNAVNGMKAGVMPPPGTVVVENGSLFYNTRKFVDSAGNEIATSTTNAFANRTVLGYVVDFEFLGANYNPSIVFIFANQLLRPEPGSEKDLQFADMVVQPLAFGWHVNRWHVTISYNFWVPTGRFVAGAINNTGKGLFSHMVSGAVTLLEESAKPWAATAQLRYEFFGKQETTEIRPGQVMTVEFGAGKEVVEGFDLGIVGFGSFQTRSESNSPPGTDTSRYRFFGVGPEVNWRPHFLPGAQVAVRAGFEFGSRNTSQGIGTILSLSYAF